MTAARRLAKVETIQQQDSASNMFNKCARTFAVQVEALKKYRSTGEQSIKVQHVTVNDGGQAVVTSTMQTGGGGYEKSDHQPHEALARDALGHALLGNLEACDRSMIRRSNDCSGWLTCLGSNYLHFDE